TTRVASTWRTAWRRTPRRPTSAISGGAWQRVSAPRSARSTPCASGWGSRRSCSRRRAATEMQPMIYRVAQWSTGNVGGLALRGIIEHPALELAGGLVHNPAKAGRGAGEIAGLPPVGVTATTDPGEIIGLGADCVSYTATGDLRPDDAVADMARILEAGTNVVSTSVVPLVFPASAPGRYTEPLEAACKAGGVSCFTSGIDPGFANDLVPVAVLGARGRVAAGPVVGVLDYSTYLQADVLFDIMGFGGSLDQAPLLLPPRVTPPPRGRTL